MTRVNDINQDVQNINHALQRIYRCPVCKIMYAFYDYEEDKHCVNQIPDMIRVAGLTKLCGEILEQVFA